MTEQELSTTETGEPKEAEAILFKRLMQGASALALGVIIAASPIAFAKDGAFSFSSQWALADDDGDDDDDSGAGESDDDDDDEGDDDDDDSGEDDDGDEGDDDDSSSDSGAHDDEDAAPTALKLKGKSN